MSLENILNRLTTKILKLYDAGKQTQYDAFWDSYQANGTRKDYAFAFAGAGWNENTFRPKYNMQPTRMYMFVYSPYSGGLDIDVVEQLRECGVTLDTSKCTDFQYAFRHGTHWGVIDTTGTTNFSYQIFHSNMVVHTIDELIVKETTKFGTMTFYGCFKLANLKISGTIGQNGFDVHWSTALSKESIESIINALSTTTSGLTVTISKTAKENAFTEEEWATLVATKPNWTIALATV